MESGSLFGLDTLTRLGQRGDVDMRPTLIRVLTDLYVQKPTHTPDEERHYTELALRLLDAVDAATRTAVAGRLSRHLSPPLQVIQRLAADLPSVAEPLRGHPLLRRPVKADTVITPDITVAAAARTQNDEPSHGQIRPEEKNRLVADLAAPIGADVAAELNELFFAANADERRLILLNIEVVAPLPAGRVSLAREVAVIQRLEQAVLARNREEFAQHLAQALHVTHAQARRIASDELGEPIVTAAKALNMPRDIVYRVLLFVNTSVGHSVERVHALATLYDEMTTQAAEHMVAIWQASHKVARQEERKTARHQPLLWNDEARARARTATATVRRAPASHRPGDRRDAS